MSFFDIVLDFILMDAFEDLENPPSSVLAVLRNRWLSDSFKETVGVHPFPICTCPVTLGPEFICQPAEIWDVRPGGGAGGGERAPALQALGRSLRVHTSLCMSSRGQSLHSGRALSTFILMYPIKQK